MPILPNSAARYEMSASQYRLALEPLLPEAARVGFHLSAEAVHSAAQAAGISPTNELFSDMRELYHELLRYAHTCVWPSAEDPAFEGLENKIPGDAVREFVDTTMERFQQHPDAVRLIVSENMWNRADVSNSVGVLEDSPVVLLIDRLLMRGHDVGAFRTDVSAEDVFVLVTALCGFPMTQAHAFHALYGMDITDEQNSVGMKNMASDAVVAFLSTTLNTMQGASYTHSSLSPSMGASVAASLYSSEDFDTVEEFNQP